MTPQTHTFSPIAKPLEPYSPEWIYNQIMAQIEPELLLESLPMLEQTYAGETQDERVQRLERYDRAFAEFDRRYQELGDLLRKESDALRSKARADVRKTEKNEKSQEMKTAESLLNPSSL